MTAIGPDLAIQTRSASAEPRRAARADAPMSFADMVSPVREPTDVPKSRESRIEKTDGRKPQADRDLPKSSAGDEATLAIVADAPAPAAAAPAAELPPAPTADTTQTVQAEAAAGAAAVTAVPAQPQLPPGGAVSPAAASAMVAGPASGVDSIADPVPVEALAAVQTASTTDPEFAALLPAEAPASPAAASRLDPALSVPVEVAEMPAEDLAWTAGRPGLTVTVTAPPAGLSSQPGAMRLGGAAVLSPTAADGKTEAVDAEPDPASVGGQAEEDVKTFADAARIVRQPAAPVGGAEPAAVSQDAAQSPSIASTAAAETEPAGAAPREAAPLHRHLPSQAILNQVAVHVSKAVRDGVDGIRIQLRPESLGQLEVNLEVASDGRVTATVTADNQDTLDLLQRDARGLERALQEAGLKSDAGGLSFNLRGEQRTAQERDQRAPGLRGRVGPAAAPATAAAAAASAAGGIDIRV